MIAEVQLINTPLPGMHYDVGLIQAPRPSSAPCAPGDPGIASAGFELDAVGRGMVTVQDTIRPGTTGVWVMIQRPSSHTQDPAEFYTSGFLVAV
ncbi:hypothetical protein F0Q45_06750 [Mycobacterium simiae]|uniref:Uncharacterized protein n=1 Tax=Mycobacterium simiae TaxID=1784 RepID=A0A5B1BQL0_MYCSI|nr:hypothetical protein F0Q45_06750 [Mycobacterium simiae]